MKEKYESPGRCVAEKSAKNVSAASIVSDLVESIKGLSNTTTCEVKEKLKDYMKPEYPTTGNESSAEEFPPYFNELRGLLWAIEQNLQTIRDCIDRSDL